MSKLFNAKMVLPLGLASFMILEILALQGFGNKPFELGFDPTFVVVSSCLSIYCWLSSKVSSEKSKTIELFRMIVKESKPNQWQFIAIFVCVWGVIFAIMAIGIGFLTQFIAVLGELFIYNNALSNFLIKGILTLLCIWWCMYSDQEFPEK